MIEGNPESPQSIVYDHSEKLSSELAQDNTFSNTTDSLLAWSIFYISNKLHLLVQIKSKWTVN